MKFSWIKKAPLVFVLLSSFVVIECASLVGAALGKYELIWSWNQPLFTNFLLNERKEIEEEIIDVETPETDPNEEQEVIVTEREVRFVEVATNEPRSGYYDSPGKKPLTSEAEYFRADENYYQNVLFIGDSLIEDLYVFGGLDEADFLYKRGLNVFKMMETEMQIDVLGNEKYLISDWLSNHTYQVIYLLCGINELGTGTSQRYANAYWENIQLIHEAQPDTAIVVMGILNLSQEMSDHDDVMNNDNVNSRNCAIAEKLKGNYLYYLDLNEPLTDENGYLKAEYTYDGTHLYAQYNKLLADWISEHAVVWPIHSESSQNLSESVED